MKNCAYCGRPNEGRNQFCIGCGKPFDPLPAQQPYAPPEQQQNNMSPVLPEQPFYPNPAPYSYGQQYDPSFGQVQYDPSRMQGIRELAASNLMLTFIILWFVQIVLGFIGSISASNGVSEALSSFEFNIIGYSLTSSIVGLLPSILIGIGFLMLYRSAKGSTPLSPSGISLVRVITIIQFVFICLALFGILIFCVLLLSGSFSNILEEYMGSGFMEQFEFDKYFGNDIDYNSFGNGIESLSSIFGAIILIGVIIAAAVLILYFTVVLLFLGSVSKTLKTGIPQQKCASVLSVLLFIMGGFVAVSIIGGIQNISQPYTDIPNLISPVLSAACCILMGVLVRRYKQAVCYIH